MVVVLGARVGLKKGKMVPALHTEMRARAAGTAYRKNLTPRFVLTGGYNIGVRYGLDLLIPTFGAEGSNRKPNFSEKSGIKAKRYRSEASVMAEFIRKNYNMPPEALILEEDSRTTEENARYCKLIVERCGFKKIGLLTSLYHMERALKEFRKAGLKVEPIFAEDLLPLESKQWINRICKYYSRPKGGKQWPIKKIRAILTGSNRSLAELI